MVAAVKILRKVYRFTYSVIHTEMFSKKLKIAGMVFIAVWLKKGLLNSFNINDIIFDGIQHEPGP
jgi:hypothetical protein